MMLAWKHSILLYNRENETLILKTLTFQGLIKAYAKISFIHKISHPQTQECVEYEELESIKYNLEILDQGSTKSLYRRRLDENFSPETSPTHQTITTSSKIVYMKQQRRHWDSKKSRDVWDLTGGTWISKKNIGKKRGISKISKHAKRPQRIIQEITSQCSENDYAEKEWNLGETL